jgi:hypothetical protein
MINKPLRQARIEAGFAKASEFARTFHIPENTYRAHESGSRPLTAVAAKQYARIFETLLSGITWSYLMDGVPGKTELQARTSKAINDDDVCFVVEYDSRSKGIKPGGGFSITGETRKDVWRFSRRYLSNELGVPTKELVILGVQGDSMEPTLKSGDRVMVDMSDRRAGQPGIFALYSDDTPVIYRLETIPGSDPPKVLRISDNARHQAREVPIDKIDIIGRVVWMARRM